jgi:hypothetical protein
METTGQKPTGEHTSSLRPETLFMFLCAYVILTPPLPLFLVQMEENVMRHRPILTGAFQRATHYNNPLPRMKVQPLHVSGMIHKRTRAREHRQKRLWTLSSWVKHVEAEARFEKRLEGNAARFGQKFEGVFHHTGWCECISLSPPSPSRYTVGFLWSQRG